MRLYIDQTGLDADAHAQQHASLARSGVAPPPQSVAVQPSSSSANAATGTLATIADITAVTR